MNTKALIFDCDGTLMDSLAETLESFHYALDRLGEPRSTPDVVHHFCVSADRILFEFIRPSLMPLLNIRKMFGPPSWRKSDKIAAGHASALRLDFVAQDFMQDS
jgi:phosphoglycolate phosphatase-like HAD superfamily hydrolase